MRRMFIIRVALGVSMAASLAYGQAGNSSTPPAASPAASPTASDDKPEEGIPVSNPLVIAKCGTCHTKDEKGNLSRISWERSTPEGWEEAIKRMVRLNGLQMTPPEARQVLKYLATYHGLAPEEAKPVMYMAEHRVLDESIPDDTVRSTCASCHALGRATSWRRTKEEWKLLTNMHVAFFPQADVAFRRGPGGFGGGGGPQDLSKPPLVEHTLEILAKDYGLHSPEWAAWRARMRPPKIAGRWLISAYVPGRGKFIGEMNITAGAADDEFTTSVKLQSLKDKSVITRTGQGLVYSGYSWRGRSKGTAAPGPAPDDLSQDMRETLWISPDQSEAEGRWFWGAYQELGIDVKLVRPSGGPLLFSVDRYSLKTGASAERVRLFGDSLPADAAASDLDFGVGVKVARLVSHTASEIVAEVSVAADAVPGKRDIAFRRAVLPNALAVYDRIDYVKVTPDSAVARLGSDVHPKGYQQFEAIAFQRGADGKPHTADDVDLGPVEATWSVEEFYSVYGDDDKEFVGTLDSHGFFVPSLDGPNPQRKFSRNNYGDVWIVATLKDQKDSDGKPIAGRSYLVVTVPTYIRWDQPEVAQ